MINIRLAKQLALLPTIRFHGNGFIQVPISEQLRLHVWSDTLPPLTDHNATVHDHAFDMKSTVLMGEVIHTTYAFTRFGEPVDVYRVINDRLTLEQHHRQMSQTGRYALQEGSSYLFPPGQFHDSAIGSYPLAATLMEKLSQDPGASPRVLCPTGTKPTDAFGRDGQPSEETMWDTVRVAVSLLGYRAASLLETALTGQYKPGGAGQPSKEK